VNASASSVAVPEYGESKYIYDKQGKIKEIHFPDGSWQEYKYTKGIGSKTNRSDYVAEEIIIVEHPSSANLDWDYSKKKKVELNIFKNNPIS
jgi:hypothetical protein